MLSYKSNISDVLSILVKDLDRISNTTQLLGEMALHTQQSNIDRIHNKGRDIKLRRIGSYDTNPIYVNPKNSPKKFQPKGKGGSSKFKNGKKRKTKYFSSGYKQFRGSIGRDSSKVNLDLSGKLSREFGTQRRGKKYIYGPFTEYADNLSRGHEKKYGTVIWGASKEDFKVYDQIIQKFLDGKN